MTTSSRSSRPANSRALGIPFSGQPLGQFGLALLVALVLLGVLQPILPLGSGKVIGAEPFLSPSPQFPFGTDELGRSLLPRVAEGIRQTMLLSTAAVIVATVLGVIIACYGAYRGGRTDELIARSADVIFSFPAVLVAVLVTVVYGPGRAAAMAAVLAVTFPITIRVIRAATLEVVRRDFISVSSVLGASTFRILLLHVIPNVRQTIIVQAAYSVSLGMLIEGGMSFLGLGVQAPASSLGLLIGSARLYLTLSLWYTLIPGLALVLAVLSVNLVGNALGRSLDRLTGGMVL